MYPSIWRRRSTSSFGVTGTNHVEMRRIVDPAAEPVTLRQLKQQARIPYANADDVLEMYIQAARETVERFLRRALITQTWNFISDWGPAWVELPYPNLLSVIAVYTTGLDNVEVTVPTTTYVVDTNTNKVFLNIGNVWPLHRGQAGFRIQYTSGYGPAATNVPMTIRRHILALAASMDNDRMSAVLTEDQKTELRPYRVEGAPFRMALGMSREDLLA
jgi:uncharacterized phiE125 gp8 family phage protein